jgi:hypothetical protein
MRGARDEISTDLRTLLVESAKTIGRLRIDRKGDASIFGDAHVTPVLDKVRHFFR